VPAGPRCSATSRPGSRPSGRRRLSTDPGASTGATGPAPRDPSAAARPSVDERAARRAELEARGRDRYDALLRHLQAGQELPIPKRRRTFGLDIHPTAGKLVVAALIVAAIWLGTITVTDWLRAGRVDTWTGPTTTVQSGQRLDGCSGAAFREDVYFPNWIRFEGQTFLWADRNLPIGPNSVGEAYLETGYTLGELQLYRVANTIEGRAGAELMIRQGGSPAGAIYALADCA
jgi:hypothetical protein